MAAQPWMPPIWDKPEISAVQALIRGDATADQQQRFMRFLVNSVCATYDLSFRPESERATAFAEGRRFVGLQIVKMQIINLAAFRKDQLGSEPT